MCTEVLKTHHAMCGAFGTVAGRSGKDSEGAMKVMKALFERFSDRSRAYLGELSRDRC
jgi:hypothetical protein